MKKSNFFILALFMGITAFFISAAFAEDDMPGMGQQERGGMMGGQGKGKMMGMMHKDSMVATADGGVVVLSGPRLIKFDKDLNFVKETEMPRGKKPTRETKEESSETGEAPAAPENN